jgi:hypothetical protein
LRHCDRMRICHPSRVRWLMLFLICNWQCVTFRFGILCADRSFASTYLKTDTVRPKELKTGHVLPNGAKCPAERDLVTDEPTPLSPRAIRRSWKHPSSDFSTVDDPIFLSPFFLGTRKKGGPAHQHRVPDPQSTDMSKRSVSGKQIYAEINPNALHDSLT